MTNEEKQALIEDCKNSIARIEKQLPRWEESIYTRPYLESELARQKIALAALTAQPIAWFTDDAETDKSATTYSEQVSERWRSKNWPVTPLFTRPAPAINLAELVPDGWKLVPIEPTERMVIDGFESAPTVLFSKLGEWEAYEAMSGCQRAAHLTRLCWAAMLAAAPEVE